MPSTALSAEDFPEGGANILDLLVKTKLAPIPARRPAGL
jgi:hypothetical protein